MGTWCSVAASLFMALLWSAQTAHAATSFRGITVQDDFEAVKSKVADLGGRLDDKLTIDGERAVAKFGVQVCLIADFEGGAISSLTVAPCLFGGDGTTLPEFVDAISRNYEVDFSIDHRKVNIMCDPQVVYDGRLPSGESIAVSEPCSWVQAIITPGSALKFE